MAETEAVSPSQPRQGAGVAGEWPAWHAALQSFRTSSDLTACWQVAHTALPYGCLWFAMTQSIQRGRPYAVTLALAVVAAAFLVRLFVLFHDCVHGSLFRRRGANTVVGYCLGVLVFTPFEDWRFSHLRHHASYANLDARGFGDIWTLTRAEFEAASRAMRLCYRLYRNPLVLIGLGALFSFVLRYRLPTRKTKRKERVSVLLTNLLIAGVVIAAARVIGLRTYLLVQVPVLWMAGALGVWLFFVQHQFEGVYWARTGEWVGLRAAMEGSSFYRLPSLLRWFSGNIGYHHVHHLGPRIPNYRLKACYEAVPALQAKRPLTIRKSLAAVRLKVWDEERGELVGLPSKRRGQAGSER